MRVELRTQEGEVRDVTVQDDDLRVLRDALSARVDDCWERLNDAISELCTLHGVAPSEIVARAGEMAAAETAFAESADAQL